MKHILTNPYHEVLRFNRGEEVCQKILDFAKKQKITAGWVWGLGAADEIEIAFYDLNKKEYQSKTFTEPFEVLSITGNIALKDGLPALHLHGTFGRQDFSTVGGHLQKIVAAGTVEIFIHKIDGEINRQFDEDTGLNLMK